MDTTGFHLSLLLLLSSQTLALKSCDNCLPVADCRKWCTKEQIGLSNLSLNERAEFNDNICGFHFNADPAVKLCCDSTAEKDACKKENAKPKFSEFSQEPVIGNKKVKCGQIQIEGEGQCGGCDDVSSPGTWPWVTRILYQENFGSDLNSNETTYCGGALVSARHVVTAAHCVSEGGISITVTLGKQISIFTNIYLI